MIQNLPSLMAVAVLQASRSVMGLTWSEELDLVTGWGREVTQYPTDCLVSLHKLQHEEDEATVQRLPNQGLEECVFALLIETLRRESLLQTLVLMSQDPSVQQKLLNASKEEDLEALAERIAESTRDVMAKAVEKQSLASAKATLASLRHDLVQATGQQ